MKEINVLSLTYITELQSLGLVLLLPGAVRPLVTPLSTNYNCKTDVVLCA